MVRAKKEKDPEKQRKTTATLAWILLVLFGMSLLVNVFTIISLQSFRRSVSEMRDPVNLYYSDELATLEAELDAFEVVFSDEKPSYKGEIRRLRKDIEKTYGQWTKASRATGTRWLMVFDNAKRSQDKVQETWKELRTKAGY